MKYLLAGLLLFSCSFSATAQTRIGVHAGYNYNTARIYTNQEKQPTDYVSGFNIGARIKTGFEPPLHFVGMLNYNMRGYTLEPLAGPVQKIETRIHYIDVAPLLNYDFKTGSNNFLSLTLGPTLGIAVSGKQKITENNITKSSAMKFSFSGNYGYANVGIFGGLSHHFNKFFIEGSYHLGVNSINNDEEVDGTNIKNRGFAVNIGYWLK